MRRQDTEDVIKTSTKTQNFGYFLMLASVIFSIYEFNNPTSNAGVGTALAAIIIFLSGMHMALLGAINHYEEIYNEDIRKFIDSKLDELQK